MRVRWYAWGGWSIWWRSSRSWSGSSRRVDHEIWWLIDVILFLDEPGMVLAMGLVVSMFRLTSLLTGTTRSHQQDHRVHKLYIYGGFTVRNKSRSGRRWGATAGWWRGTLSVIRGPGWPGFINHQADEFSSCQPSGVHHSPLLSLSYLHCTSSVQTNSFRSHTSDCPFLATPSPSPKNSFSPTTCFSSSNPFDSFSVRLV